MKWFIGKIKISMYLLAQMPNSHRPHNRNGIGLLLVPCEKYDDASRASASL
jgi:hypothetical protein